MNDSTSKIPKRRNSAFSTLLLGLLGLFTSNVTAAQSTAGNDYTQVLACFSSTDINVLTSGLFTCSPENAVISILTPPENGTTTNVANGKITYAPASGFTGLDSIQYEVSCNGIPLGTAWMHISIIPCPDNINTADCVTSREGFEWKIREDKVLEGVRTTLQFQVGDLNDDGNPEIVAFRFNAEDANGDKIVKAVTIFWGPDFTTTTDLPLTSFSPTANFNSISTIALGKVKMSEGVYKSLVFVSAYYSATPFTSYVSNIGTYTIGAFDPQNPATPVWTTTNSQFIGPLGLADFNNDGYTELYMGNKIYDAATGTLLCDGGSGNNKGIAVTILIQASMPQAIDIIGDNRLELVAGNQIYDVKLSPTRAANSGTMTVVKSVTPPSGCPADGLTVVGDFDNDGQLEVLVRARNTTNKAAGASDKIYLYLWTPHTATSQVLASTFETNRYFGIPFVGDIDGDRRLEIVSLSANGTTNVTQPNSFRARRYNKVTGLLDDVWQMNHTDQSGATVMTLFDFNQSGTSEIVYRDEDVLRVFDGSTNPPTVLFSTPAYSETSHEYPVVADVFGTGHANILTTSDNGGDRRAGFTQNAQLRIYSSAAGEQWAPARNVWNQYAYNAVNINEDLTIPQEQVNPATIFPNGHQPYNAFLQQQTLLTKDGDPFAPAPNIVWDANPEAAIAGDSAIFTGRITNIGEASLVAPIYITYYKNDTLVPPGEILAVDSIQFVLNAGESLSFSLTLKDLSSYASDGSLHTIWISINDRNGVYPYQPECMIDGQYSGRRSIGGLLYARNDTVSVPRDTIAIPVLANDNLGDCKTTGLDSIRIGHNAIGNYSVATAHGVAHLEITGTDTLITYQRNAASLCAAYRDSISYTIYCGFNKSTAWVFFNMDNLSPSISDADWSYDVCAGSTAGTAAVTASGGTLPYTYSIDPNTGTNNNDGTFSGLTAGTYVVTILDNNNCTAASHFEILTRPAATPAILAVPSATICTGTSATLTATADEVNNPVYRWYASQTAVAPVYTGNSFTTGILTASAQRDTIFYVSVEGGDYCENAVNNRLAVNVRIQPTSTLTITPDSYFLCNKGYFTLTPTLTLGSGVAPTNVSYYGWLRENQANPGQFQSKTQAGSYFGDMSPNYELSNLSSASEIPSEFNYTPSAQDKTNGIIVLSMIVNTGACSYARDTITLHIDTNPPDADFVLVEQPTTRQQVCTDTAYILKITDIGAGGLADIQVELDDWKSTGIAVKAVEYMHPIASGIWRPMDLIRDFEYFRANIPSVEDIHLENGDSLLVRYTVYPGCDFFAGSDLLFLLNAKGVCHRETIATKRDTSAVFNVDFGGGEIAHYSLTSQLSTDTISNASTTKVVTWSATYTLTQETPAPDYAKEAIYFVTPPGMKLDPTTLISTDGTSFYDTIAPEITLDNPSGIEYKIPLYSALTVDVPVTFEFQFEVTDSTKCDLYELYMEIIHTEELTCVVENTTCDFHETQAGSYPDLVIDLYQITLADDQENSNGRMDANYWSGTYRMHTATATMSNDTVNLAFYVDMNNNGIIDAGDVPLDTIPYPTFGLPADTDFNVYIGMELPAPYPPGIMIPAVGPIVDGKQLLGRAYGTNLCDDVIVPLATLFGPQDVCQGDTVVYYAPTGDNIENYSFPKPDAVSGATPLRVPLKGNTSYSTSDTAIRLVFRNRGEYDIKVTYQLNGEQLNPTYLKVAATPKPYLDYVTTGGNSTDICRGTSVDLNRFIKDTVTANAGKTIFYYERKEANGNYTLLGNSTATFYVQPWETTTYRVSARVSELACESANTLNFTVNVYMPSIDAISIVEQSTCGGSATGAIKLVVTGGSGHYQYSLNDSEGTYTDLPTDSIIRNLSVGDYVVYIKDKDKDVCSPSASVSISLDAKNSGLKATASVTTVATDCDSDDGIITLTVHGGIAPYAYQLDKGTKTMLPVDGRVTDVSAGTHTITVYDSDNCSTTVGVVLVPTTSSGLTLALDELAKATCDTLGKVRLTISGGTTPYSYHLAGQNWIPMADAIDSTRLQTGMHYFEVKDANGCMATGTVTITNDESTLSLTIDGTRHALCDGTYGGAIYLAIEGGLAPYTYTVNGTDKTLPAAGKDTISNLAAGAYKVNVVDANGCETIFDPIRIDEEFDFVQAVNDRAVTYMNKPVYGNVTANDFDYNNSILTVTYPSAPVISANAGTFTIAANGAFTYTPTTFFVGKDSILYTIANACGRTGQAWLIVDVLTIVPDIYPPVAVDDYYSVIAGGSLTNLNVTDNDADPHGYPLCPPVKLSATLSGMLTQNGDGTFNYTPNAGFVGVDEFSYEVCNTKGLYDTAYVYIHVYPQNISDSIKALSDAYTTLANTPLMVNPKGILTNDILPAGDTTVTILTTTHHGTLNTATDGSGSFTYVPHSNYYGADYFIYKVCVNTANGTLCDSTIVNITVVKKGCQTIPPVVVSSQQFCGAPTIADLQVKGQDVKWYDVPTGGMPLASSATLTDGATYYASQTVYCESTVRSAVTVRVKEDLLLPTPDIDDQTLCNTGGYTVMLSDVIIKGDTAGLVWYNDRLEPITDYDTWITKDTVLYAAYRAGTCISNNYKKVTITLANTIPVAPPEIADQSFCEGATIGDIRVPNNQIDWYDAETGGELLDATFILISGTYYASQRAGACESATRTPVVITIGQADRVIADTEQFFCGKPTMLGDLVAKGYGVKWYASGNSTDPLSLDTELETGATYYAAQTSENCEGERTAVKVKINPLPEATITANDVCEGEDVTFTITLTVGNNSTWEFSYTYNATTSDIIPGRSGENTTPIIVGPRDVGSYTYILDYLKDGNGCVNRYP